MASVQPPMTIELSVAVHPELANPEQIDTLMSLLSDFAPVLDEIGLEMSAEQREAFDTKGASSGYDWKPNAPTTDAAKRRQGYSTEQMVRTGALAAQVGETMLMYTDSVTTGIDMDAVSYAKYHQYGSESGRPPQRVLVAVTQDMVEKVRQIVQEYFQGALPGASGSSGLVEVTASYA